MPVCVPTPVAPMERCDYLPWISSAFEDDLSLDIDGMSFDHISNVLSRCATPPPESMAASPMESAMTSPSQSHCPSPIHVSFFLESLFECDELDSSVANSLASTPFCSSPASPAAAQASTSTSTATAPCTPLSSNNNTYSSSSFFPTPSPSTTSYSSPCSPVNGNSATIASLKQQARRISKSGELKPMKAKKMAKESSSSSSSSSSSIAALSLSNNNSSSSSSSSTSAANKMSKRCKAVALASKRDSHNISERNRRQELKLSFNVLQNIVPNLISAARAHTGTVLKETIAYIVALQQQEEQLIAAKNALLAEQSALLMSQ